MDKLYSVVVVLLLYICLASTEGSEDISSFDEPELYRGRRRISNPCSVPTVPRSVTYSDPERLFESDRKRWKYVISWQAPATINCASISSYQIRFPDESSAVEVVSGSTLQKEYYTDGNIAVNFLITATNDGGFTSAVASQAITTALLPPQPKPTSLTLTASSSGSQKCADVTWQPPEYPNGDITKYQVKCGNTEWEDVISGLTHQKCGFDAYEEVSCLVNAHNSEGVSYTATSPRVRMFCDAPSEPSNIAFGSATQTTNDGRERLLYTVTWQAPATINCASISSYQIRFPDESSAVEVVSGSTLQKEYYTDGNIAVNFLITATNDGGFTSAVASQAITTDVIPPQGAPRNLEISATSRDGKKCVKLTYLAPEYPNGEITNYEIKCGGFGWRVAPASLTRQQCGFGPYQEVSCLLRATNSAGYSPEAASAAVRMFCDAPSIPDSISFGDPTLTFQDGRDRWTYSVSWQAPDPNCESIVSYTTRYPSYSEGIVEGTETSREITVDGDVEVAFYVTSKNNERFSSAVFSQSIRTPSLRPQIAPRDIVLVPHSEACVNVSWLPPMYPNGQITNQKVKCTKMNDWTTVAASHSGHTQCGYSPYEAVRCMVKSVNSAGESEAANSTEVKTLCAAPSVPTSVTFGDPTEIVNNGRERWQYTVTWEASADSNCESLSTYSSSHTSDDGASLTAADLSRVLYADGDEDIEFSVSAANNAGINSTNFVISTRTPVLRPQVAPSSVNLVASGPYCVIITWEMPQYLNGPITGFRVSIPGLNDWLEFNWDISQLRSYKLCDLQPYQFVQFNAQVMNSAGNSDSATSNRVTTDCAAPTLPSDLSPYVTEELYLPPGDRLHRRKITLNVDFQDITTNCDSITSSEFWLEGSQTKLTNGETLEDLDAETNYTIYFEAANNENLMSNATVVVKTGELEPNSAGLTVLAYNLSCVLTTWTDPVPYKGLITDYQHRCALTPNIDTAIFESYGGENNFLSCNYNPADKITCQVKAFTAVGEGPVAEGEATIGCDAPAKPNMVVTDKAYYKTEQVERITMTVTWEPTPPTCKSIEEYEATVTYGDIRLYSGTFSPSEVLSFQVSNLEPITNYSISLKATNDQGYSSTSSLVWKTSEIKPSGAPGLQLSFDARCVNISASSPEVPNGQIRMYQYTCRSEVIQYGEFVAEKPDRHGSTRVCGFLPASKIICTVSAVNTAGLSPSRTIAGYTPIELSNPDMEKPYTLLEAEENSPYIPIRLHPVSLVNVNPEGSKYRVIVSFPGDNQDRVKRSLLFPSCYSDNLFGYKAAESLQNGCYIAADVEGLRVANGEEIFYLGDGETYGEFENVALKPNQEYNVTVAIVVPVEDGPELLHYFESSSFSSPPPPVIPPPTEAPPACGTSCIIGICVGLLVLLIIIIIVCIVICCKRRSKKRKETITGKNSRDIAMAEMRGTGEIAPTPATPLLTADNEEPKKKEPPKLTEPIDLEHLSEYIKDKNYIAKQYENVLEQIPMPTIQAARLPENKGKCKYVGIYPGDSHRVKLYKKDGDGTDFINASFIAGYSNDNEFIAAQGPQKTTTADFWLMIFQQKPKAVVMLTNITECGQEKCQQYWPDHIGDSWKFGEVSTLLTRSDVRADCTVRDMTVTKGEEAINIQQYHFTSWTDHGLPYEMGSFLSFVRKLKMETSLQSGPVLVHCSAGVGRTGTLIGLMNLMDEAREKPTVDVLNCVARMRERRCNMVQVQAQYYFLHCALEECLQTDKYICYPTDISSRLETYASDKGSPEDFISAEYQRIEEAVSKRVVKVSAAVETHNILKNRSPDIFPDENYAVFLDGGDYINAVAVDDFRMKNNLFCTQVPLSNTVADFWRMVENHEVKVIVQLEQQDAQFYPENDEGKVEYPRVAFTGTQTTQVEHMERRNLVAEYAGVAITRTQTTQVEHMERIDLLVEYNNKERSVCLLVAKDWDGSAPAYSAMIYYLAALDKQQQQHRGSRVCIADMDGSKRCGLFVAAYNAVEKLKTERMVDLYNIALMARCRRKQFLSSIDEMVYLYSFLKYYSETVSDDFHMSQETI